MAGPFESNMYCRGWYGYTHVLCSSQATLKALVEDHAAEVKTPEETPAQDVPAEELGPKSIDVF